MPGTEPYALLIESDTDGSNELLLEDGSALLLEPPPSPMGLNNYLFAFGPDVSSSERI